VWRCPVDNGYGGVSGLDARLDAKADPEEVRCEADRGVYGYHEEQADDVCEDNHNQAKRCTVHMAQLHLQRCSAFCGINYRDQNRL